MNDGLKKFDLSGKTALVTGGATGIGYYMTRGLMASGAKVLIAARRVDVLKMAKDKLQADSLPGEVIYHRVDLSKRDSIIELAEHAVATMGGVDIFVGNAGQDMFEHVEKITNSAIDQMYQVNVSANVELVRAFLPGMRKKKWGRIMFSSSSSSLHSSAQEGMSLYTMTKAALNAFARTIAAEAGHDGVTANSLVIGLIMTEMLADVLTQIERDQGKDAAKAFLDSFAGMTALGRLGRVDEIEGLVQFVASDAASYLTGSSLVFDGGLTTMLRPNNPD